MKIPIVEWEYEGDVTEKILRLPYPADISFVAGVVGDIKPLAVIPPYKERDASFSAKCASVARDRIQSADNLVALVGGGRRELAEYFDTMGKVGFRAFAFPNRVGRYNIAHFLTFIHTSLRDDHWYHVAGARPPRDSQADGPGVRRDYE